MAKSILGKMELNDLVSFDLHVSSVLPQDYHLVRIKAIIPASVADKFGTDVYALHAQVYRLVPQGQIEDNPDAYYYLVVETQDKETRVVGIPWINKDTIRVFKQNKVTFSVVNCADEDIQSIRDAIARHGYHVKIKREDTEEGL